MREVQNQVQVRKNIFQTMGATIISKDITPSRNRYGKERIFSLHSTGAEMNWLKSTMAKWVIFGIIFGSLFPIAGTILGIRQLNLNISWENIILTQKREQILWIVDLAPLILGVVFTFIGKRENQLQLLNNNLLDTNLKLRELQSHLEEGIQQSTEELRIANEQVTRRARQLQAVSEIAKRATEIRNVEQLLPDITNLISVQFGFYHIGIFLLDLVGKDMVLAASNSEGGQRMLQRSHQLPIELGSIVGYVATTRQPRIALDVGADTVFFDNPDLPETHSEMALPLMAGDHLIGILDIQSVEINAFAQEDIEILATLADQITIAIENSRLFEETNQALATAQDTYQRYFEQSWKQFVRHTGHKGFLFENGKVVLLDKLGKKLELVATNSLSIPLMMHGQVIGTLDIQPNMKDRHLSENEVALAKAVAERAALALENARLLQDAQRRAAKESQISEISTKIIEATEIDKIMAATVSELQKVLGASEVSFRLNEEEEQS